MDWGAASFFLALGLAIGSGLTRLYERWWKVRNGVVIEFNDRYESAPLFEFLGPTPRRNRPPLLQLQVTVHNRLSDPLKLTSVSFWKPSTEEFMLEGFQKTAIQPHDSEEFSHSRADEKLNGVTAIVVRDGAGRTWTKKIKVEPRPSYEP